VITLNAKLSNTMVKGTSEKILEFYPKLKRYCLSLTGNSWDSEDLAQEAIVKALSNYVNQKESEDFCISLLYTIARNQWIDQIRKNTKLTTLEENRERVEESTSSWLEVQAIMEMLLTHFTEQQTVTFLLKDVFQYSMKEIADSFSTTEGAVKASLFRMRTKLKTGQWDVDAAPTTTPSDPLVDAIIKEDSTRLIRYLLEKQSQKAGPYMGTFNSMASTTDRREVSRLNHLYTVDDKYSLTQKCPVLAA
jgi:RNA polymerase sigma-70 factor, ECF subfamily